MIAAEEVHYYTTSQAARAACVSYNTIKAAYLKGNIIPYQITPVILYLEEEVMRFKSEFHKNQG